MAGIYTHIPFCYTRCSYCDFYKTTDHTLKSEYKNAICKELSYNEKFFNNYYINTLYFGGGTPSVLSLEEWAELFACFGRYIDVFALDEVTVEVNPDDVTPRYLQGLHALGVNRISMGIQSFVDSHLRQMNRRHNSAQAVKAIEYMRQSPISNLSIDLIYGLPYMSNAEWERNVEWAVEADVQHISAYHLTIEKGTPYYDLLRKGKIKEIPQEQSSGQFEYLSARLEEAGFENYEISNFARPGFYSRHNSSYWTGAPYLGLGPSAHSYYEMSRRWNISNVAKYIELVSISGPWWEEEKLNDSDIYNERIMLGLRTSKGFELEWIKTVGNEKIRNYALAAIQEQVEAGNIEVVDGWCRVSKEHKFITDRIISDLFYVEEE